ncbi:hypothetical protein BFJ70_g9783 [Fusarium oxysporum]|nr:hypothetical protein BFJ70_g9783 [Fusarium oxysporum]
MLKPSEIIAICMALLFVILFAVFIAIAWRRLKSVKQDNSASEEDEIGLAEMEPPVTASSLLSSIRAYERSIQGGKELTSTHDDEVKRPTDSCIGKSTCRLAMRVSNEESYRSVRNLCAEGVVYDVYGDIEYELYFNSVSIYGVKFDGVMAQPEWQAKHWDRDPLKELGFQPLTLNSSDRFEWRDFHSKKKKKETPQRPLIAAHGMPSNRYI